MWKGMLLAFGVFWSMVYHGFAETGDHFVKEESRPFLLSFCLVLCSRLLLTSFYGEIRGCTCPGTGCLYVILHRRGKSWLR